jgi:hypothetical protein
MDNLEAFIVEAKKACYVGNGRHAEPSRLCSHDHAYVRDGFSYRDSYFGGIQFCGQEVVWTSDEPVWSMVYFGFIFEPLLLNAEQSGAIIRAALSELYQQHHRFLGGMRLSHPFGDYCDETVGDYRNFKGRETIMCQGRLAFELQYQGGLIVA